MKALQSKRGRIDIDTYFPGRGGAMTTIYLSRHAHQSGIHYRTEQADDGPTPRPTQGGAIDNTFKSFLGDYAPVMKDPAMLAELERNRKASKPNEPVGNTTTPVTVNRLNDAIFAAARQTYNDMWGEMKPKLKRALEVQELAYYNSIAKIRGLPAMQRGDMAGIFKLVVAETEAEIGTKAGFAGKANP